MENVDLKKVETQVEVLVNKYLDSKKILKSMPGYTSVFLHLKKKFLKELYNIDWHSPEDLSPESIFD